MNLKIILYNFEKLSGYRFSAEAVTKLVKNFPNNIIGCKDSSYNLFENLKLPNFLMFPGSEAKLLKGSAQAVFTNFNKFSKFILRTKLFLLKLHHLLKE